MKFRVSVNGDNKSPFVKISEPRRSWIEKVASDAVVQRDKWSLWSDPICPLHPNVSLAVPELPAFHLQVPSTFQEEWLKLPRDG